MLDAGLRSGTSKLKALTSATKCDDLPYFLYLLPHSNCCRPRIAAAPQGV